MLFLNPEEARHGLLKGSMLSMLVSMVRMQTGRPGTLHEGWVTLVVEGGHGTLAESQPVKIVPAGISLTWEIEKIDHEAGGRLRARVRTGSTTDDNTRP